MRLPISRRFAAVAAIVAATAIPVSTASAAQAATTAPARSADSIRPADSWQQATMDLNVQAGTTVHIQGGGGGTSNCTYHETDETIQVTKSPTSATFGFEAKSDDGCAFEPSWSNFVVTVRNSSGVVVASRTVKLIGWLGFYPYEALCSAPGSPAAFHLDCSVKSERYLVLTQTGTGGSGSGPPQPNDHWVGMSMVLNLVKGETVHINSPSNNCTRDETDRTFTITSVPQTESFGFEAKNTNMCAFESSYASFDVTVRSDHGDVVAFQKVNVSNPSLFEGYQAFCDNSGALHMVCEQTGDTQVTLTQLTGTGTGSYYESALLTIYTGGPGPSIKIEGGGGGRDHSNCTSNETSETVGATADPTRVPISFEAKESGDCFIEASYSYFTISLLGTTASGRPATGTARIFFGQPHASGEDYEVSCVATSPSVTCDKTSMRDITLHFNG
jgi:hypothetical protein